MGPKSVPEDQTSRLYRRPGEFRVDQEASRESRCKDDNSDFDTPPRPRGCAHDRNHQKDATRRRPCTQARAERLPPSVSTHRLRPRLPLHELQYRAHPRPTLDSTAA